MSDLLFDVPTWLEDSPYNIADNPCAEALAQANREQERRRQNLVVLKKQRRTLKIEIAISELEALISAVDVEIEASTGLEKTHA